ncbi:MAG: hypothetical protein Rubg2KO_38300 [Rubricoccaceae bacterium]
MGTIDVWVRQSPENADRIVDAIRDVGFDVPHLVPEMFLADNKIVRMGVPPNRVEVMTSISGVTFEECWAGRKVANWDGMETPVLSLAHLRRNKEASGRYKDLADLVVLPREDR